MYEAISSMSRVKVKATKELKCSLSIREFNRLNLPIFDRKTNPIIVEKLIKEIQKKFNIIRTPKEYRVNFASFAPMGLTQII